MKYLAIDLGQRRIGIAVSDSKGIVAEPVSIIERRDDDTTITEIVDLCTTRKIDALVIGVPYSAQEEQQHSHRDFGEHVAAAAGLPLHEWDETFSTKQAQNMVAFADQPSTRRHTRTHRDDVAAAVILQEFLDHDNSKKNTARRSRYSAA